MGTSNISTRTVTVNPFKQFQKSINKDIIKHSIITRLYDYVEYSRRSIFSRKITNQLKKRWLKFLKLSLYLLDNKLKYPDVLYLNDKELKPYIKKYGIRLNKNILISFDNVWSILSKKYKL